MKVSYSKISTFNTCPFLYRLKYLEHLESKDNLSADNPLFVGTACHEAIEKRSVEAGVESYKSNYPEISKMNDLEIEKIKIMAQKAIDQIPVCEQYEYKLEVPGEFIGYIDGLYKVEDGLYDIYDFKTSNNVSGYKNSPQVHLYKYYFERLTGNKVRDLYYVFIPKSTIKLDESYSETDKDGMLEDLKQKDIHFEKVDYNPQHVNYFFARKALLEKAKDFNKRQSMNCHWCEFRKFCQSNGVDRSELKE